MEVDVPEQKVDTVETGLPWGKKQRGKKNKQRPELFAPDATVEEKKRAIRSMGRDIPGQRTREELSQSIVYIAHLPRGFEEPEMRGFFSQFGKVENVKLVRSKRVSVHLSSYSVSFFFFSFYTSFALLFHFLFSSFAFFRCHVHHKASSRNFPLVPGEEKNSYTINVTMKKKTLELG
jgi:RNA recognition motif-containing protein